MAEWMKRLKALSETPAGALLTVVVYAVMVLLVLAFFTGHGAFIYEGF